jgi:hypothetical protein
MLISRLRAVQERRLYSQRVQHHGTAKAARPLVVFPNRAVITTCCAAISPNVMGVYPKSAAVGICNHAPPCGE